MKNGNFLFLLIFPILLGCVKMSRPMINSQDQQVTCESVGFGWFGAPAAAVSYGVCVQKAQESGFIDLADYEKTERPKFERLLGLATGVDKPLWQKGYRWSYRSKGVSPGNTREIQA